MAIFSMLVTDAHPPAQDGTLGGHSCDAAGAQPSAASKSVKRNLSLAHRR
jgi:hypothetical protein